MAFDDDDQDDKTDESKMSINEEDESDQAKILENEDDLQEECPHELNEENTGPIKLRIDMSTIPCIPNDQQDLELQELGVVAYEQRSYEKGVLQQVDDVIKTRMINQKPCEDINSKGIHKKRLEALLNFKSASDIIGKNEEISNQASTSSSQLFPDPCDQIKADASDVERRLGRVSVSDEHYHAVASDDDGEDNYVPSEGEQDEEDYDFNDDNVEDDLESPEKKRKSSKKDSLSKKIKLDSGPEKVPKKKKLLDDGDEVAYQKRIKSFRQERLLQRQGCATDAVSYDDCHSLEGDFKVPKHIWSRLYGYQQVGVQWLWELHQLGVGGILGDEMGLGKTIQIIAFLAGLSVSEVSNFRDERKTLGPVILVTPATVMYQWVAEFHAWWPFFRVAILHHTGSFHGKKDKLVRTINQSNGILITSYCSIVTFQDLLYKYDWHYVILDEGHKIRNPDAQTTLACKRFRTPHRLILSGSPIQNNLKELWSLFDFIYPGKLGTLPVFMEKFAVPITQGGYANASQIQVEIAYRCATVLRDAIKPYLLRRMKDEVQMALNLPNKNEQVLFCRLTDEQRDTYKAYLESGTIRDIFKGKAQIFVGLINLRKICNHPDIFTHGPKEETGDIKDTYGYYKRSGKMKVVDVLLRLWHKQEHKVLLFTQGKQMLTVLEIFLKYREYTYLKMDGTTPIGTRQQTVKEFNSNPNIFVFLLTTKVGGVGLNLIGANRVIIFDPDWNPTTDMQARERAWRIGQDKQVTIYRLLTAGTVEEKIYHRQVFKQYLTNRVLKDPKQRRFFKTNDLYELFTLGSDSATTESSALFAGTGSKVKINKDAKKVTKEILKSPEHKLPDKITLPPEKIRELQEKAKKMSQMIAKKFNNNTSVTSKATSNFAESNDEIFKPGTVNKEPHQRSIKKNDILSSSKSETSSKGKGKHKGTVFEGKRIKYLVKSDDYAPSGSGTSSVQDDLSKQQDDYVLKKLFKKSTMHSALQHDVIEGSTTADFTLIESEADKVANEAIKALRRSRQMCLGPASGIPTWTGSSETLPTANRFGKPRRDRLAGSGDSSLSSKSFIEVIKERNKFQDKGDGDNDDDSDQQAAGSSKQESPSEHDELLNDIRNFVAFQASTDGEATTQEILEKFKNRIPANLTPVFKSLLWKICDFFRRSDGVGVWRIKGEFR